MNTTKEFKCAACGGVFEKSWSDAEAVKEAVDNFGKEALMGNVAIICDDCYKKFMVHFRKTNA